MQFVLSISQFFYANKLTYCTRLNRYTVLGWSLFFNLRIFDVEPIHSFRCHREVILVKFGHDYSPFSRISGGLKNSQRG